MNIQSFCKNIKIDSSIKISHNFMDGGCFRIPEKKMNDFYHCYLNDLKNNRKNSIVEQKTSIFKFFIDLDLKLNFVLSKEQKEELAIKIQSLIKEFLFFTSEISDYSCIISSCEPLHTDEIIKNGIHILFPNIFVNKQIALKIREILIQGLYHSSNKDSSLLKWEDIIKDNEDKQILEKIYDDSVYKGSGLRLMFSYKYEKCVYCMGDNKNKNTFCVKCNNLKKNYSRPYFPLFIIDNDKNINYCKNDINLITISDMFLYSIRTSETELNIDFETPLPNWFNSEIKFLSREEEKMNLKEYFLIEDDKISRLIEMYIKEFWSLEYKNIKIKTIYKTFFRKKPQFAMRTNCHFCFNINRNHKSNHIWLVLSCNGILSQRCFDENCKKFISSGIGQTIRLPQHIISLLTENKNKNETPILDINQKIEKLLNVKFN